MAPEVDHFCHPMQEVVTEPVAIRSVSGAYPGGGTGGTCPTGRRRGEKNEREKKEKKKEKEKERRKMKRDEK